MSVITHPDDGANLPSAPPWSKQRKLLVTAAVAVHLFAVFAGPCASPPPASYLWNLIAGRADGNDGFLMPYLRAAYLNHGYRFFAPNPGPSHLVRFEIDLDSGTMIEGQFPDVDEYYPRLLYHRMFMISETAFSLSDSVRELPAPDSLSDAERIEFNKQLATSDALAKSIARRLLSQHQGKRVRLYIRTHEIPFPSDVAAGQPLSDPALFHEYAWRSFGKEQL